MYNTSYDLLPMTSRTKLCLLAVGLNTTILKADIQIMLDVIGTDATEQACEQEGHKLFSQGLLSHSVPLICHS